MRRTILTSTMTLISVIVFGQTIQHNVLKFGQNPYVATASLFSQTIYEGSARSSAMGNAFISLGGDIGALSINPAASGIYKYSEFAVTPGIGLYSSNAEYLGTRTGDIRVRAVIPSLGYVANFSTKNKSSAFKISFAVNKVNDFNSRFAANGSTNESSWLGSVASLTDGIHYSSLELTSSNGNYPYTLGIPWRSVLAWNTTLLDLLPGTNNEYIGATENLDDYNINIGGMLQQSFIRETTGGQNEILINGGGRIGSNLFIGANIGIQTLTFADYQKYTELAQNSYDFQTGFDSMTHIYRMNANGIGINAKLGVIYNPIAGLRLGATLTTPTIMTINETWEEKISSKFNDGYNITLDSPIGEYSYNIITPAKLGLGISYIIGKFAIVSADYEAVTYSLTRLNRSEYGYGNPFVEENNEIARTFNTIANNFRIGTEIKPTQNFALRCGYSFYQSAEKNSPLNLHLVSAGLGFTNNSGFFMDFSIQHRVKSKEDLKLYQDYATILSPRGELTGHASKLLISLGFRF